MKKIVALLMASAMAASLAACGGSAQSSEATSTAPAESTAARDAAIAEAIKSATIFFICVFLLSVNSVSGLLPFRGDLSLVLFQFFSNYYLAHLFYNLAVSLLFRHIAGFL